MGGETHPTKFIIGFIKKHIYKDAIHACPTWNLNSNGHEYSAWKTYLEKYFGVFDGRLCACKNGKGAFER